MLDSVAALIRKEPLTDAERDAACLQIAAALKLLAASFDMVVLVTNQILAGGGSSTSSGGGGGGGVWPGDFQPMLGLAWGHSVGASLQMALAAPASVDADGLVSGPRRYTNARTSCRDAII